MSVGQQICRARESIGLQQEKAAEHLGLEPDKLRAWEEGREEPSFHELCDLGDLYGRSLDYFLRDIPPSAAPLRLRLREGRKELSPEGRRVRVEWEEFCRRRMELEGVVGAARRISLPEYASAKGPASTAQAERKRLSLGEGPVENIREVLGQQGVYVFEIKLPVRTPEFSGCSQWHESYGPCILANAREPRGRRNFTMAHEYYHLLVHRGQAYSCAVEVLTDAGEERSASRFAAAFLMTQEGLATGLRMRQQRSQLESPKDYAPLATKWRVSVEALLYALRDFSLLPRDEADRLLREWTTTTQHVRWPKGKPRPTQWQRRLEHLGHGYTEAAVGAYREGRISLSKLAEYLGMDIREARKAAEAP